MRKATVADAIAALEMLEETGCYVRAAAEFIGCDRASLTGLLGTEAYKDRYIAAQIHGAEAQELLAIEALKAIPDDGTKAQVARQRELASHYRWAAKIRNPKRYGDKVQQEITGAGGGPIRIADVSSLSEADLRKLAALPIKDE